MRVRVRMLTGVRAREKLVTHACFTNKRVRARFTNEEVLRARNECERVTRDSFRLVRLCQTRIYTRVMCKDFKTYYMCAGWKYVMIAMLAT